MSQISDKTTAFDATIEGAQPSPGHLAAWPTISRAASMMGKSVSVLSRAMDAEGATKHLVGRRDKKIAPVTVMHFARVYGADVDVVADEVLQVAEESGAAPEFVASVEADLTAWLLGRARRGRVHEDAPSLEALVQAITDLTDATTAEAILERAKHTSVEV